MSDYSRFETMRARSFFVMCVVFYGKRGDKFLACGPMLFKHTCNFDVNKLLCIAVLNWRRSVVLKNVKKNFAEVCFEFLTCI